MFSSKSKTNLKGDQIDEDLISIPRSDGKKHDLNVFAAKAFNMRDIVDETNKSRIINRQECEQESKEINVKRSDGLSHDIIKVFKAFSDPKGESMRIQIPAPNEGLRRSTLGKIDMQQILSSSGKIPLPPLLYSYHPTSLRIVHMSDTHNFLVRSSSFNTSFLPAGDILIHSGNFTEAGEDSEYDQFNSWLGSVSDIYHYRVIVVGNKDVMQLGNDWDSMRARLPNATHVLCHSEATVLGLRMYGVPWHWGHETNYSLKAGAPDSYRIQDIPDDVDVLITHGPAFGRLDSITIGDGMSNLKSTRSGHTVLKMEHWGSKELYDVITRVRPGLHLHGHIRAARGVLNGFGHFPLTLNSCMTDADGRVLSCCPFVVRANAIYSPTSASTSNRMQAFSADQSLGGGSGKTVWEFTIDALVS